MLYVVLRQLLRVSVLAAIGTMVILALLMATTMARRHVTRVAIAMGMAARCCCRSSASGCCCSSSPGGRTRCCRPTCSRATWTLVRAADVVDLRRPGGVGAVRVRPPRAGAPLFGRLLEDYAASRTARCRRRPTKRRSPKPGCSRAAARRRRTLPRLGLTSRRLSSSGSGPPVSRSPRRAAGRALPHRRPGRPRRHGRGLPGRRPEARAARWRSSSCRAAVADDPQRLAAVPRRGAHRAPGVASATSAASTTSARSTAASSCRWSMIDGEDLAGLLGASDGFPEEQGDSRSRASSARAWRRRTTAACCTAI